MSRPFRVGDRVTYKNSILPQGEARRGVVAECSETNGISVSWDSGFTGSGYRATQLIHLDELRRYELRGAEFVVQGEGSPIRVTTRPEPPKFRVGDRVAYLHDTRRPTGTVTGTAANSCFVRWDDAGSHTAHQHLHSALTLVARPLQVGDVIAHPGGGEHVVGEHIFRLAPRMVHDGWTHADGTLIYVPESALSPMCPRNDATVSVSKASPTADVDLLARALHATDPRVVAFVDRVAERPQSWDEAWEARRVDAERIAWDRDELGARTEAEARAKALAEYCRLRGGK